MLRTLQLLDTGLLRLENNPRRDFNRLAPCDDYRRILGGVVDPSKNVGRMMHLLLIHSTLITTPISEHPPRAISNIMNSSWRRHFANTLPAFTSEQES